LPTTFWLHARTHFRINNKSVAIRARTQLLQKKKPKKKTLLFFVFVAVVAAVRRLAGRARVRGGVESEKKTKPSSSYPSFTP
jgi:hypothetical protein